MVKLQLGDGMRDALLVDRRRLRAELNRLAVRENVGQGIRLHHDGEREVVGGGELLGVRLDELLLVDIEPTVGASQLACRLSRRAVAVGQVVQDLHAIQY